MPAIPEPAATQIGNKADRVSDQIETLAREVGPGGKLPTLRQMCARFEVSRTTVERAMLALERRGLLERRHGSGIYATDEVAVRTVGVVFGGDIFTDRFSPFWTLLLDAVREHAGDYAMQPRVYFDVPRSDGGQLQLVEDLESYRLDGLFLLSPKSEDEVRQLQADGAPLVVFGEHGRWRVTHDQARLMELTREALVARGCRRVALLGMVEDCHRDALTADFEVLDWSWNTWAGQVPSETREQFGCELGRRLVDEALPDAVVSLDDTVTRGLLTALDRCGRRAGRDLTVVSAANRGSPVLQPYADELVLFEYDPHESVRAALGMLQTLLAGSKPTQFTSLISPRPVDASSG